VHKITLKLCYFDSEYNGLAFQPEPTPFPTVEGILFGVLAQTWLVDPKAEFEGCRWERCERMDRGVSGAAGQVWVRTGTKNSPSMLMGPTVLLAWTMSCPQTRTWLATLHYMLPDDVLGDDSQPLSLTRTEALRVTVTLPLRDQPYAHLVSRRARLFRVQVPALQVLFHYKRIGHHSHA
jgi:hypothetical protein